MKLELRVSLNTESVVRVEPPGTGNIYLKNSRTLVILTDHLGILLVLILAMESPEEVFNHADAKAEPRTP